MSPVRIIARLDVKGPNLIKGVRLEGLRKVGDPNVHALRYYWQGIDELIYMDIVASLYGRNHLGEIISSASENVFVPMTAGGGVRSIADVTSLLEAGADKVAINTQAVQTPELITEVSQHFGSQCMVLSIEAKLRKDGSWEAFTDNGREHTGLDVVDWAKRGAALGAGEIMLTSVDQEGTRKGMEVALCRAVSEVVDIPVILSGGAGSPDDILKAVQEGKADGVALADMLHYERYSVAEMRACLQDGGIRVRDWHGVEKDGALMSETPSAG